MPTHTSILSIDFNSMLGALVSAGAFGLLGIALMALGFKVFDWITPRVDVQRELSEHRNVAVAIVVAAVILGTAIMLAHVISA